MNEHTSDDALAYGQGLYDHERQCRTYYKVLSDCTRVQCSEEEFLWFIQRSLDRHNSKPLEQRQQEAKSHWEQSVELVLSRGQSADELRALAELAGSYGDWMTKTTYTEAANRTITRRLV